VSEVKEVPRLAILGHGVRAIARLADLDREVAVAHSILLVMRSILLTGRPFEDLGEAWFDQRDQDRVRRSLTRRLERLGY
jgi:hypothetical protein